MPLVATLATPAESPVFIPVDDRRLDFRSLDGQDLLSWGDDEWIVGADVFGLDVAPRLLTVDRVPGLRGSRLREIDDGPAEMVLPLWVKPTSRDWRDVLSMLARVRSFMSFRRVDYVADEGTFDLVASTRGRSRYRRCVYQQGLEGDYANPQGFHQWRRFALRVLAVDPDWHGEPWSTPIVRLPISSPFLTPVGTRTTPLRLTSSIALGTDMPVTVGGDIPSPVTVEIGGPATSTHITSPQGLDVTVGALTSGQTFRLETGRRKRALLNGVSAGSLLSSGPQWRPLPPGGASISVEVTGATSETWARVFGESLWETPW